MEKLCDFVTGKSPRRQHQQQRGPPTHVLATTLARAQLKVASSFFFYFRASSSSSSKKNHSRCYKKKKKKKKKARIRLGGKLPARWNFPIQSSRESEGERGKRATGRIMGRPPRAQSSSDDALASANDESLDATDGGARNLEETENELPMSPASAAYTNSQLKYASDVRKINTGSPGMQHVHNLPRSSTPGGQSAKSSSSRPSTPTLRSGEHAELGAREFMEDATVVIENRTVAYSEELVSFYGVFDGHGGTGTALYLKEHLVENILKDPNFQRGDVDKALIEAYVRTDLDFYEATRHKRPKRKDGFLEEDENEDDVETSGSTACTACLFDGKLIVANAGDSRCVVSRNGIAHDLTRDQKPSLKDEEERIKSAGGFIEDGYVNGLLGVSRAFGDWHFEGLKRDEETGKPGPLTAEPEIDTWEIDVENDEFLILACDGLWDVFSSQNAVDFARKSLLVNNNPNIAAKQLADEALRRHSADNISVVCVCFGDEPPRVRTPELTPASKKLAEGQKKNKGVERSLSLEVLTHLQTLVAEDEQKPMADNLHGISPKRMKSVRLLSEFQNQEEDGPSLSPQNSSLSSLGSKQSRRAGSNTNSSFEVEELEEAPSAHEVANVLAKVGLAVNSASNSNSNSAREPKSAASNDILESNEANQRLMQVLRRARNTSSLAGSSLEESELGKIAEESFADALSMRNDDDDDDKEK